MWKRISLLLRKNNLLWCWDCLSLLKWIGAYIISINKTASYKIGALICSVKFLSPRVALYLFISTIQPCTCCHVWTGAAICYLELLYKLQKEICRTVGPSLAASLEPLVHHWNVPSQVFSIQIILVYGSFELAQLVPLPYFQGRSTRYSDRLHDSSVTIPWCYKDVYVKVSFLAKLDSATLHKKIQFMLEFLKAPFLVLHFSYYTLMTFLMMLSIILLSMLMILLYYKYDKASDLWQLELASELKSDLHDIVDWGRNWLADFNTGKIEFFHLIGLLSWLWNFLPIDCFPLTYDLNGFKSRMNRTF